MPPAALVGSGSAVLEPERTVVVFALVLIAANVGFLAFTLTPAGAHLAPAEGVALFDADGDADAHACRLAHDAANATAAPTVAPTTRL
jgi:hypothetical protein